VERKRLDQAIAERHPAISRRQAKELLSAGRVLVNDRPVGVASRMIAATDRITLVEELPPIPVLKLTAEWVAVDKPAGLPVQPVRERDRRSLEELIRLQLKRDEGNGELYLVHRIDTQTSGVVVFARTREAAAWLSSLFASREIGKTYLAVVEGVIADVMTIETPIDGKDALTFVRPRKALDGATLIEADIETGRTHQIRIHLSSIGHPVLGDGRYGSKGKAPRMLLHSWKLEHESLGTIVAPHPSDFPLLDEPTPV
jgi:23S rRNA pseudouridine1911/1915/1917 synthase